MRLRVAPVLMVFGTGCLIPNPSYEGSTAATESQSGGGTSSAPGSASSSGAASGAASTASTASGGGSAGESSGGALTGGTTGLASATGGGSSSGGIEAGESSGSTGAPPAFCDPAIQAANQCVPLGATPYLVCDALATWQQGVDACAAMCGRLAVILTPEDQLAAFTALRERMTQMEIDLEAMMPSQPAQPLASLWVGGHDVDANVGGPFAWIDGTQDPGVPGQGGWGPNDPDEAGACMVIGVWGKMPDNGDWFDRTCTTAYRFVCDPG